MSTVLFSMHWILLSSGQESLTFDEPVHIAKGMAWEWRGDHRINTESGLIQPWLSAAFVGQSSIDRTKLAERAQVQDANVWDIAAELLEQTPLITDLSRRARRPMIVLTLLFGLLVWAVCWRHFGRLAAILALSFYIVSPNFLGHGRLANADVLIAMAYFVSTYALWRFAEAPDWRWAILVGGALALAILSKHSGWLLTLLAPPVIWVLVALRGASPSPRKILPYGALAAGTMVLITWAAFGFQQGIGGEIAPHLAWERLLAKGSLVISGAFRVHQLSLLPEPSMHGIAYVAYHADLKPVFLSGLMYAVGVASFFPLALLMKTPLGTLGFLLLAGWGVPRLLREVRTSPRARLVLAMLLVACLYIAFAVSLRISIGYRHMLPALAHLLPVAAAATAAMAARRHGLGFIAVALCLLSAVEVVANAPNHLSFMNVAWGGPANGYRHLVDSSNDWGQNLPALARWRKGLMADDQAVYLAYFGTDRPDRYLGNFKQLPSFLQLGSPVLQSSLQPGLYVISTTMLACVYCGRYSGAWKAADEARYRQTYADFETALWVRSGDEWLRFARLASCLRTWEPSKIVANTIVVYDLNREELRQALDPLLGCRLVP